MCSVIGAAFRNEIGNSEIEFLKTLFCQAQIRGLHATGISWIKDKKIKTVRMPTPAKKFVASFDWAQLRGTKIVGHCRYSTSDREYNQPIFDEQISMVHNGVVTQEEPEHWPSLFGGSFLTKNDSEVIFNCIRNGENPMEKLPDASMAVLSLKSSGEIFAFRNGKRPLYAGMSKDPEGLIVASTRDILLRSGVEFSVPLESGSMYEVVPGCLNLISKVSVKEWQR